MRELVHADRRPPDLLLASEPVGYLSVQEAATLDYHPAKIGMPLDPSWKTYWFLVELTIPENWAEEPFDLLWETGSESTIWLGERALQALNTSDSNPRPDARIVARAEPGARVKLAIE